MLKLDLKRKEKGVVFSCKLPTTALVLFSCKSKTNLAGIPKRGYASRTGRLDIPIRTSYFVMTSKYIRDALKPRVSIVILGGRYSRIHIMLDPDFWSEFGGETEREVIEYFRESILKRKRAAVLREGLYEAVQRYVHQGYVPAVLRERGRESLAALTSRPCRPIVLIVGTDCDPPEWVEKVFRCSAFSLGSRSYLALHAALFTLYTIALVSKLGMPLSKRACVP